MTRMAPLPRGGRWGSVSVPSSLTFYYRRGTLGLTPQAASPRNARVRFRWQDGWCPSLPSARFNAAGILGEGAARVSKSGTAAHRNH